MLDGYWWGMHAKQRREQLGLTQQQVADATGLSRAVVAKLENWRPKKVSWALTDQRKAVEGVLRFDVAHAVQGRFMDSGWGPVDWVATWWGAGLKDVEASCTYRYGDVAAWMSQGDNFYRSVCGSAWHTVGSGLVPGFMYRLACR